MENNNQIEESKTDGFELLEKVIKSNEENIKSNEDKIKLYVKLRFMFEDHLKMMGQTQLDFEAVGETYQDAMKFHELESVKRTEFLKNIPTKIEAVLSPETVEDFEKINSKMKEMKILTWSSLGTMILGILILVISINFATNWYKESIKAKSELRQNILNEIAGEGKKIYDESEVKALSENTKLMQLWIKNNPKKAEDFLRFKDGYDAKNTTERESE
ncbi:hypothetical protein FNJ88_03225 [Chryseobacterium sp. SNU WT5]|uniref:hypothetical protein n=1 Tax=Chryseobacterium sp. SNU WT5 TaxID=2594269 RepID=UPI00117F7E84|nr:hypothetical protein [Chryseobacterium sp. SNU WT5]QDP84605.1 hypothetical protein FNJ88_03225 [Chryseobacterium sp. SNU WT5]